MESGTAIIPKDISDVLMSEPELVELFGVIAPILRAAIRAVYKSCVLKEYEPQKYVRLENGYNADVYAFPNDSHTCFPYQYIRCGTSAQCHV